MRVSESRRSLLGVLTIKKSYYLGVDIWVPYFRQLRYKTRGIRRDPGISFPLYNHDITLA